MLIKTYGYTDDLVYEVPLTALLCVEPHLAKGYEGQSAILLTRARESKENWVPTILRSPHPSGRVLQAIAVFAGFLSGEAEMERNFVPLPLSRGDAPFDPSAKSPYVSGWGIDLTKASAIEYYQIPAKRVAGGLSLPDGGFIKIRRSIDPTLG